MSRIADDEAVVDSTLKQLFFPIADALDEVETILQRELRSEFPFVDELVRYGCLLGGKRLRPALLLLTAQAVGQVTDKHLVLATVVEMIHTATLVHDDVLDEADLRRHLATVNARWDEESSILLGDFLFSRAFYLASSLDTAAACRIIGRATNIVCEGEIRQKGFRGGFSISESQYIEILQAKTAELCACCCQLGACFAATSDVVVNRMAQYGRYLGIAFQIADDLLDILGNEAVAGKSLGTDLQKQKPTLPLIHALAAADESVRKEILAAVNGPVDERLELVMPLLARMGSIDYARGKAAQFSEMALEELTDLSDSPATSSLRYLARFVVERVK